MAYKIRNSGAMVSKWHIIYQSTVKLTQITFQFVVRLAMPDALHLSLFVPIRISIGKDHSIDLPVRKEEALLAYLAPEHGHAHSRESLPVLFWCSAGLSMSGVL